MKKIDCRSGIIQTKIVLAYLVSFPALLVAPSTPVFWGRGERRCTPTRNVSLQDASQSGYQSDNW